MPRKYIIANWKMNMSLSEALQWLKDVEENFPEGVDGAVCPPFVYIRDLVKEARKLKVGAQNVSWAEKGAYTGEVAAYMLRDVGADLVIIGHSERRKYFNETNQDISKKITLAVKNGLEVVLCVGETLEQRQAGRVEEVVRTQLREGLDGVPPETWEKLTIAYEPVWAIGTGVPCKPEDAIKVIEFIRDELKDIAGEKGKGIRVLYGGSIKPDNFEEFLKVGADGGLVGGASLKADSFIQLLRLGAKYSS